MTLHPRSPPRWPLFWAVVALMSAAAPAVAAPAANDAPVTLSAADKARASVVATEAIYLYRDKRYLEAAKSFLRAFELTKKTMPRMLRNAAKAYESAGHRDEALKVWEQLEQPLGETDLTRKEAALLRKEARIHVRDLRLVIGQQLFEGAEQHYSERRYLKAGDAFIEAYSASARQSPSYLRFAARAYQRGGLVDEALMGWRRYGTAAGVGTIGKEEARKQQAALQRELDSLLRNKQAVAHYRAGRFQPAAAAFLSAYEKAPKKRLPQLRMAAMSFEHAQGFVEARHLWRRYAGAPGVSALGRQEADDRVLAIDLRLLTRSATDLVTKKQYQQAGDKWLEVYALSRDKDPVFLRKAALVYEQAKALARARTMWLRYSTAPAVTDDDQEAAHARAQQLDTAQKSGEKPPPPPIRGPKVPGLKLSTGPAATCTGCKITALLGAAVAVGGMVMWANAEHQSMQLSESLRSRDGQGLVIGIDAETAAQDEKTISTNRTVGFALMGAGGAALIIGVITDLARGAKPPASTASMWHIGPTNGGLMLAWETGL